MLCVSLTPAFARVQTKPGVVAARTPSAQARASACRPRGSVQWIEAEPVELDAPGPGEFPGLEALFAEHGTPLRRLEGHGRFLAASRARRLGFDPLAGDGRAGRAAGPLALAGLAPLRFILEVLVGEELLFSRRPDELRRAIHAPEDSVLELHRSPPRRGRSSLLRLAPELLPISLARQGLLRSPLVPRLQIEGVFLDILDDVFLLHLPLEAAQRALDRLSLLNFYFSHECLHPLRGWQ